MGFLPGVTTPGGMTHQAIEDISVMRSIPNMTILETGDATEVESVVEAANSIDGPVYARVLRGQVPRLFDTPIEVGRMRELALGRDVLVITAGITTEEALRARGALAKAGVSIRHLHVNTIKPFNSEAMFDHVAGVRFGVVTLENHVTEGGVGSLTSEIMTDAGIGKKLIRLGLKDTYAHGGSRPCSYATHGLDAPRACRRHRAADRTDLRHHRADLEAVRIDAVHSAAKAEAL